MKPGDMAQLDDHQRADKQLRATVALGAGIIGLMLMALSTGIFFGWLIWGAI